MAVAADERTRPAGRARNVADTDLADDDRQQSQHLGRTLGLQQSQSASDAALLAAIQAHSRSAQGQMQALQAGNELASITAQQLMQLRQTVAAQAQLQGGWIAVQAERQAAEDAALRQFLPRPVFGPRATRDIKW